MRQQLGAPPLCAPLVICMHLPNHLFVMLQLHMCFGQRESVLQFAIYKVLGQLRRTDQGIIVMVW